MANVDSNITVASNACRDVIGVKGVCNKTYPYYLDSLGISLSKAAKLADSSMVTARELIDESINDAWGFVFSDLRADGFNVNGVQKTKETFFTDEYVSEGTYTFEVDRKCDIEQVFVGKLKVNVSGLLDVVLTANIDGVNTTVFDDTLTDETLTVNFDNSYTADKITYTLVASGSGTLQKTSDGGVMKIDSYVFCAEKLFYCKYWSYLVNAVMYKASANILNSSLFSDRYNDLIVYKKDEIAIRIAQLDSSLNVLPTEARIGTKGLYQLEIIKINDKLKEIVKQSYCTCCFKCDNVISSSISIP